MKKIFTLIACIFVTWAVFGQTESDLQFIEQTLDQRGEIVLKFQHNGNRELVRELGQIISIDKVTDTYVQAYANRNEYELFKTYNLEYEPVYEYYRQTRAINMATNVAQMENWDRYPTYAVYLEMMHNYATTYPTLCKMDTVGYSVNNRPIITMIISDNVGVDEDEPEFWWSSTMHGDETSGWYFLIRLVDELLTKYDTDEQIRNLVNNVEIYISPLTNPDGTFYQSNDGTSIQNARRYNQNYVDLNRNFPFVTNTASHTAQYPNEPEITMMTAYADAHNFVMSANCHGGDECMNYPWDENGWTSSARPNADDLWWEYISRMYVDTVHSINSSYFTGPSDKPGHNGVIKGSEWYSIDGGRQDYMNYYKHIKETTIEFTTTKKLDSESLNTYWGYNRKSILNYTEQVLYGFRGIVTDGCTNQPLSDVKVFINNHDTDNSEVYTSAPIGNYHRPIYAGTYSVTFSKDGYISQTFDITTQNMACQRLDVTLYPEGTIVPTITANPTTLYEGSSVQFNNTTSGNYVSASWSFDGGSPATSTATNPSVTYNTYGTYDATLTIVNTNGCSASTTEQITVYEAVPPVANFSASETSISTGSSVTFTDLSTNMPNSWSWTFEGGNPATSTLQNPTVTYSEPGEYTVTLVASNAFGSDTETKTEYINVVSIIDMSSEPIYVCSGTYRDPGGESNYTNNINNLTQTIYPSTEGAYIRLTFSEFSIEAAGNTGCYDKLYIYDGTSTSAPVLVDGVCGTNNPGTVTATNTDGALTIMFYSDQYEVSSGWVAEISCYVQEPEADFSAAFEECTHNVTLTNESTYATSYLWDFGDGTTSTESNPSHTYATNGIYTISLTATNANGSNTTSQQIEIAAPEIASVTPATGCTNTNITVSATGTGTLHWFDAATGGTELGTGESYSANFNQTTTLYVEAQQGSEQTYNVGIANNTSASSYTQNGQNRGLTFTVSQNLTLMSVDVYCTQNNLNRTITITNSSNSQSVYSQSHTLSSGLNTLNLNVELEPGTYNIYASNVRYTYRQTGSFPYSIDNVISITGPYNTNGNYYYTFFNWAVKASMSCTSERTPVTVTVIESGDINLGEPITQCGGSVTIDAGNGFNNYIWSNQQTGQSITVNQSGTYTVTATNGQCEVTASRVVTINPVPSVSITENNDVLTADVTSGTSDYNFMWSEGNATTQSINMTHNGNYCVTVTDANECQASACVDATMDDIEISLSSTEHGNISGETSVEYDGNYTFTVTPDNCYTISDVTVNGNTVYLDANNSYTINNVTTPQSINVTFSPITYTISATAGNGGSITPGTSNVNCGENITFAIAASNGYRILDVTVDGQSQGAIETYTFNNVNENGHSISATFIAVFTINVTADAEGGLVSPNGPQTYDAGESFTLTVTPEPCYEIGNVTVNGNTVTLTNNSYTINNVTENQTINVTFNQISYTITASAGNGGSITPNGANTVTCGGSISYSIAPADGYMISEVLVDGQSIGSQTSYTFNDVTEDHTISATFELIPAGQIVITVNADDEGGTVSPTGTQTITEGDDFPFTVTPDACYEIGSVTVNGTEVTLNANNSYTIHNVTEEQEINVTFNLITYTIAATAGTGGSITPAGNATVNCGESQTYTIAAAEGYTIEDVLVDGQSVGAVTSYTFSNVTGGHSINAIFSEIIVVPECLAVTNLTVETNAYGTNSNLLTWTAAENAESYLVYCNGVLTTTTTTTSYFDIAGGIVEYYIVTNCGNNNLSEPSDPVTAIPTSIDTNSISVELYPNPTDGKFMIECNEMTTVEIFNMVGQSIGMIEVNSDTVSIDASAWTSGIYSVRITTENSGIIVKQIVKQ